MLIWQRIAAFTWDRQDVMRACDGNKAATQVLEYLLYCFRLRAKDHHVDDLDSPMYEFSYPIAHLVSKTHFAIATVRRGIRVLKEKGLVIVTQPKGYDRTATYRVNFLRIEAWFKEKFDLFPVNHPDHANENLPHYQPEHIEVINVIPSKGSTRSLQSDQTDPFYSVPIIPKSPKIKEAEESQKPASAQIATMVSKTGLVREQVELILEKRPPDDLVNAATACWLERVEGLKDISKERPVRFFRGFLSDPGAFGAKRVDGQWTYPTQARTTSSRDRAIVAEAKRRIEARRADGYDDRTIYSELSIKISSDLLREAFQETRGAMCE